MLWRLKTALLASLRNANRYVLVHYPVVTMMQEAVATCPNQSDSGGILLGSVRGRHLEITGLTMPEATDERTVMSFVRQDHAHQAAADFGWRHSMGDVGFMGEWHTHPSGPQVPSMIDRGSWALLAAQSEHPMCFPWRAPGRAAGLRASGERPCGRSSGRPRAA